MLANKPIRYRRWLFNAGELKCTSTSDSRVATCRWPAQRRSSPEYLGPERASLHGNAAAQIAKLWSNFCPYSTNSILYFSSVTPESDSFFVIIDQVLEKLLVALPNLFVKHIMNHVTQYHVDTGCS